MGDPTRLAGPIEAGDAQKHVPVPRTDLVADSPREDGGTRGGSTPVPASSHRLAGTRAWLGPLVLLAVLLSCVAIAHRTTFEWMVERWSDTHDYYGHGPLVPLVSIFLAWRVRDRLSPRPERRAILAGTGLALAALAVHVVDEATLRVHFVSGATLVALLFGTALAAGGFAFARALAFPLGFLAFAVPLPELLLAIVGLELKHIAAGAAILGLRGLGVAAIREGSIVHLAPGDVTVEDVCSGLRSLISLLALGVIVAGLDRGLRFSRRAAIVALALPVALAANALRVAFLCLAVELRGPGVLETWIHEGSGLLVFALSLALLLRAKKALGGAPDPRKAPTPATSAPASPRAVAGPLAVLALAAVPAALATTALERAPRSNAPPVARGLALDTTTWTGTELPIEPYVRKVLLSEDLVSRRYAKPGRALVSLYIAASRGDRKVAHPPELCLSGIGFSIEEREAVALVPGVTARKLLLVRGPERELVVYFYAAGTTLGPDYLALQLRSALERLRDPDVPSALVRFSTVLEPGDSPASGLAAIQDLAREVVPAFQARLSEGTP